MPAQQPSASTVACIPFQTHAGYQYHLLVNTPITEHLIPVLGLVFPETSAVQSCGGDHRNPGLPPQQLTTAAGVLWTSEGAADVHRSLLRWHETQVAAFALPPPRQAVHTSVHIVRSTDQDSLKPLQHSGARATPSQPLRYYFSSLQLMQRSRVLPRRSACLTWT